VRPTVLIASLALSLVPSLGRADRGALTLEIGPAVTWWQSLPPPVGTGSGISGSTYGGVAGIRYGLSNSVEVSATGFYEAPQAYAFSGVSLTTGGETLPGTLNASMSRWGAMIGARYVQGFVWRLHVGAEVGWNHEQSTKLDLVNVSNPSNPESYGLGLANSGRDSLIFSPLVGVEWLVTDHWSIAFVPRIEVVLGAQAAASLVLPVTVGYCWYVF